MAGWIEHFLEHTDGIVSPELFRKWTAISTIAAALERKVWVRTSKSITYPNMYIILCGPAGVGKGESLYRGYSLINELPSHHVAPSSVTSASLIDSLNEATRIIQRPQEVPSTVTFNSLYIVADELGVLLPGAAYDKEFMNILQNIYDHKVYSQRRRTRSIEIEIKRPQLNIIAACTPAYLHGTLPESAWDEGFASRTIMVFSDDQPRVSLFAENESSTDTDFKQLVKSLRRIGGLFGKMSFTESAAAYIDHWQMNDCQPKPEHPKLNSYNSRRKVHAIKLAMIASVNESESLVIEKHHVDEALNWLFEAESFMPDIFKSMSTTSHARLIEDTWYFIFKTYNKQGKKPILKARVVQFLSDRTPAHNVERVLSVMEQGGLLRKVVEKVAGRALDAYVPREKRGL